MIPVLIVGHPERQDMIDRLTDRFPHAEVFLDRDSLGAWANHRCALAWAAEHIDGPVLVLEDDAIPSPDLEQHLDALLERFPDRLISLYAGTGYPTWVQEHYRALMAQAEQEGRDWFELDVLCHAVAYVIPTAGIAALLAEADKGVIGADERLSRAWWVIRDQPVVYAHPSLVDHADATPVERHLDGQPRTLARRAHAFRE